MCGNFCKFFLKNLFLSGWTSTEPEAYHCPYIENKYSPQVFCAQYSKIAKCKTQIRNLSVTSIDSIFRNPQDVTRIIHSLSNPDAPSIRDIELAMKKCNIKLAE